MKNLGPEQIDAEYFRLFFTLSMDMFCIAGSDGYFKHINSSWGKVLGYTPEELKSQPYMSFVHPEDIEKTVACAQASADGEEVLSFENRYRCKDGSYKHFRWASCKHPTEELIFAVARDITEQKQLEEDLYRGKMEAEVQREYIHALLSQVPAVAAVLKGPDHVFEFANQEYCQLIGNRNPVGLTVREAVPGLDQSIFDILSKVYQTGDRFSAKEMPIEADWHANGKKSKKYFNFVYSPLRNSNREVTAIWVLAFDITEMKSLHERLQLSEKMASLGTLAAGVAHEINNPLAFVMVALETISRQIEDLIPDGSVQKAKVLKRVSSCTDAIERIAEIVRSLKSFSRKDSGEIGMIDVSKVLKSTIKFVEAEIKHRAQVRMNLTEVPQVIGNEGKLSQVLINLLVNAAQAIPAGRVEDNWITIDCRTTPSNQVEISITDTGCGIPNESLNKIFEPFYTTKSVGEGTGLGLSISHGIISSMNGTLSAESETGRGATFRIVLPAAVGIQESTTLKAS